MKTTLLLTVALCSLSGPVSATDPAPAKPAEPAAPAKPALKGMELYSWQDGSQWKFSLLVGTNREKSLEEVQSTDTVLIGVNALKSTLGKVAPGQYISWSLKETLSFPPDDIIKQVEKICEEKGLILSIAK